MKTQKSWTVLELIHTTTQYLTERNIESPRLNAECLLAHTLNLSRIQLYVSFERPLSDPELQKFRALVKRRAQHEPLQYIFGQTEFMGYPMAVNRDVLIPRPETEILVEEILKLKKDYQNQSPRILDIGSGSGCIAIALLKEWPSCSVLAIDSSAKALQIVEKNCQLNQIDLQDLYKNSELHKMEAGRLYLFEQDILQPWPSNLLNSFDIIVSNPPYITRDELSSIQAEVKNFEPLQALTDFSDGLHFYRQIFKLVGQTNELNCTYLYLEMSGSQSAKIIALAHEHSFQDFTVINDLNQIPRVLKIKVKR